MSIDFKTARPRDIEAYLREQVRKIFGDNAENRATIFSSHGYYSIALPLDNKSVDEKNSRSLTLLNFRRSEVPKIVKAMRAISK